LSFILFTKGITAQLNPAYHFTIIFPGTILSPGCFRLPYCLSNARLERNYVFGAGLASQGPCRERNFRSKPLFDAPSHKATLLGLYFRTNFLRPPCFAVCLNNGSSRQFGSNITANHILLFAFSRLILVIKPEPGRSKKKYGFVDILFIQKPKLAEPLS